MKMKLILIVLALQLTCEPGAFAAETFFKKRSQAAGKALLANNCASCHAISKDDSSSHPTAVAFRNLSKQYPVAQLAEALAEGIMSGHPDMPTFEFSARQVDQIIDYLEAIQIKD